MKIFRANHLRRLLPSLLATLQQQQSLDPCRTPWIIAPNDGVRQWLMHEIARHEGVYANLPIRFFADAETHFPFWPPYVPCWNQAMLRWQLVKPWRKLLSQPQFRVWKHYLEQHPDEPTAPEGPITPLTYACMGELAALYDRYQTHHRPSPREKKRQEGKEAQGSAAPWPTEGGPNEGWSSEGWPVASWQRLLWEQIPPRTRPQDLAENPNTHAETEPSADDPTPTVAGWHVFGFPEIPRRYLEILRRLVEEGASVCLYLRHVGVHPQITAPAHPLFAALGESYRRFAQWSPPLLAGDGNTTTTLLDAPLTGPSEILSAATSIEAKPSLLHRLQRSLAEANDDLPQEDLHREDLRPRRQPEDFSMQFHRCHHPLRQVEVLRDSVLQWLNQNPQREASDVLVLTPSIEIFAPLVRAVFDAADATQETTQKTAPKHADPQPQDANTPRRVQIPYRLLGASQIEWNPLGECLYRLLALAQGRMTLEEVLALLRLPPVKARFDIDPEGSQAEEVFWGAPHETPLPGWLSESGVRFARDASQRQALDLPAEDGFTWQGGHERLALAAFMPSAEASLSFGGRSTQVALESDDAPLLARWMTFYRTLCAQLPRLQQAHTIAGWRQILLGETAPTEEKTPEETTQPTPSALEKLTWHENHERRWLEACWNRWHDEASAVTDLPITPQTMQIVIESWLNQPERHRSWQHGGVTIAPLGRYRHVPAAFIALLGLDEEVLPRAVQPPGTGMAANDADTESITAENLVGEGTAGEDEAHPPTPSLATAPGSELDGRIQDQAAVLDANYTGASN